MVRNAIAVTCLASLLACGGSDAAKAGDDANDNDITATPYDGERVAAPFPFNAKLLERLPEDIAWLPVDVSRMKILELSGAVIKDEQCNGTKFVLPADAIYYLRGDLIFSNCVDLEIRGAGSDKTVLLLSKTAARDRLLFFNGGKNVTLTDVLVWGNGDNRPTPDVASTGTFPSPAVESWNVENLVAERIRVEQAMSVGFATLNCSGGHIQNSRFLYNGRGRDKPDAAAKLSFAFDFLNEGIGLNNAKDFTVSTSEIEFNSGSGIAIRSHNGGTNERVRVTDTEIFHNGRSGSPAAGIGIDADKGLVVSSSFERNKIHDNAVSGIWTNGRVEQCVFTGNLITNNLGASGTGFGIQLATGAKGNTGVGNRGSGNAPGGNANSQCLVDNDVRFGP